MTQILPPRQPAVLALRSLLSQAEATADVLQRSEEWAAAAECETFAEVLERRLTDLSRPRTHQHIGD